MSDRPSGSVGSSDIELDAMVSTEPNYQPLTAEIEVPREWPVEAAWAMFVDVVKMAIDRHLLGQKVIVTVDNVSALVTKNETRAGYLLERTEDTDDEEAYRIDLLMPAKAVMISLKANGWKHEPESVQMLPSSLKSDHPVSRMFVTRPDRHKVLTIIPDIEKILKLRGVTGPKIHSHVLKLTYSVRNFGWFDDSEPQEEPEPSTSAGPSVSAKRISDGKREIVYYERAMPPRRRWLTWKTALTGTFAVLGLIILVLLIYFLAFAIKNTEW